jgi:hypothetical protein
LYPLDAFVRHALFNNLVDASVRREGAALIEAYRPCLLLPLTPLTLSAPLRSAATMTVLVV